MMNTSKDDTVWNDVRFFPFGHITPALEDMRGVAAVCGGNKIQVIRLDPIEEKCNLLYEIVDKSSTLTGGRMEIFNSISWSIDPVSLQPILAAGGVRGVIKLFDARTAAELGMFYGHGGTIFALSFSPTHPHVLASASIDHTVRIWNTTLPLKPAHIRQGTESQALLSNWDNPPGQLVTILAGAGGHTAPVCSVAWHPIHPLLATGGMDNHVKIWYLSQLPGFPRNSPLQDDRLPESLQTVDQSDPVNLSSAPITSLPIFNSKHLHSHWVDQIIWAGRLTPILVSKSSIIAKGSRHPLAAYAFEEDLEPATRVCIWQPSILEDVFLGKSGPTMTQDAEANIGGVDFDMYSSFKVRKPGLDQEEESIEWGLGMCLTQTQVEGSSKLDLAILIGNHPKGIAEFSLSSLEDTPKLSGPAINLHSSSTSSGQQNGEKRQNIFRAIDSTPMSFENKSTFALRVGQSASIELWKREFLLSSTTV
ncbi:uncharacterized protein PGTG_03790 [Puccinia graminis f. sp. tritici CRL 75-36-700-3]|uniref:Uncharacterized protein n=2 Tax=Puccinia graminis f. sp. tritici TaxID=56615 RepID=E3K0K9_PUCGT|nr:uncharacterized protein PGTG_03790 [Puccinia graminis f. sp. tritici CRL 75-36-700-3]EFP77834.2 hypothetical protein PGTG_03790 [Puccinia graminis f. sp. tritici CRL 75-36-700-3]